MSVFDFDFGNQEKRKHEVMIQLTRSKRQLSAIYLCFEKDAC